MTDSFIQCKSLGTIVEGTNLTHLDLSNTDVDNGIAFLLARYLPLGRGNMLRK
jgi:hypothetical protein